MKRVNLRFIFFVLKEERTHTMGCDFYSGCSLSAGLGLSLSLLVNLPGLRAFASPAGVSHPSLQSQASSSSGKTTYLYVLFGCERGQNARNES